MLADDSTCAGREELPNGSGVQVQRFRINIRIHRAAARGVDSVRDDDARQRLDDHLLAGLESDRPQVCQQRLAAGAEEECVTAQIFLDLCSKSLSTFTASILPRRAMERCCEQNLTPVRERSEGVVDGGREVT